jgi:sulfur-carrier protein adenylyltransferase/sulfurtransferase
MGLVEATDGVGDERFGIRRREPSRRRVLLPGGDGPLEPLQRQPVEQLGPNIAPAGIPLECLQLARRRQPSDPRVGRKARDEGGLAGWEPAEQEIRGADRIRGIGVGDSGLPPRLEGAVLVTLPEAREPEVEEDRAAPGVRPGELLEPSQAPVRPGRERLAHLGLGRRVAVEHPTGAQRISAVRACGSAQRLRLGIAPNAEVDDERRHAALALAALVVADDRSAERHSPRGRQGDGGHERDPKAAGHVRLHGSPRRLAILRTVSTPVGIREIEPEEARERLAEHEAPLLIDVRTDRERGTSYIPDSIHLPMAEVEQRIGEVAPDPSRPIITYCATGRRSLRILDTLEALGYGNGVSMAGGIVAWQALGYPTESPSALDDEQLARYSRHLLIPEVGIEGQERLLETSILLIGAGGLGSPAALYLAAAGVGRLGIVDDDRVDASNLQRQVLHSTAELGESKAESAREAVEELNPDVQVVTYEERLTSENVDRILGEGWEFVVDGADNFPTRYLLNDASVWHGIPVVHGSIYRFEGQATVFKPFDGPCYRCLFPQPPPPELAPSCAEGGVLGVLPGVIGSLQANEALKLALEIGEPLIGRLLLFDALTTTFSQVTVRRDPDCPVCGDNPTITEYIDYAAFCGAEASRPAVAPAGQSPAPPPPDDAGRHEALQGRVSNTVPSGLAPPAPPRETSG